MTHKNQPARVLWNKEVIPGYFSMGIACDGYDRALPGQFVMLQISGKPRPLLRRPFSIHGLVEENGMKGIEILYKVVGTGTQLLSEARENDPLGLLGPLGNSFLLSPPSSRIFLVGGGIGVPPLVFLARTLKARGVPMAQCRMFLGGRSRADLLCMDDFQELGMAVHVTTDDGSFGDQCLITSPVEEAMEADAPGIVYACGPLPMLSCLVGITKRRNIRCQVSIESMMACGIGACLGCAVPKAEDNDSYFHVCKDGPVFEADQVRI